MDGWQQHEDNGDDPLNEAFLTASALNSAQQQQQNHFDEEEINPFASHYEQLSPPIASPSAGQGYALQNEPETFNRQLPGAASEDEVGDNAVGNVDPLQDVQIDEDKASSKTAASSQNTALNVQNQQQQVSPVKQKAKAEFRRAAASSQRSGKVQLSNPEKCGDGLNSYISYTVTSPYGAVKRRYGDFNALYSVLRERYPQYVIPPLPSKQRLEYLDRFSEEFIEKRRVSLERFLCRLLEHTMLGSSDGVKKFLSLDHFDPTAIMSKSGGVGGEEKGKIMDNVSDYFVNAFAKVKKPEDQFLNMHKDIDTFTDGVSSLDKVFTKLIKVQTELSEDYGSFATAMSEFGDDNVPVECAGNQLKSYCKESSVMASQLQNEIELLSSEQELNVELVLKDQIGFGESIKDVLKVRDQKQIEFESLSDYLAELRAEKSRLSGYSGGIGSSGASGIRSSASAGAISKFLKDKVEEMKGATPAQIKAERLVKVEAKIGELEKAVDVANTCSLQFNKEVIAEFQKYYGQDGVRAKELRTMLKDLVQANLQACRNAQAASQQLLESLQLKQ
ncbi:hypothetical protein MIR68_003583 [Amoeboaphelidium protococcarum]|nr:hypothetical protein MIR68_003583 [Amoeboaphelidium protococcarum]